MQVDFRNPFSEVLFRIARILSSFMCDKFKCSEMQALLNYTTDGITVHNAAITINAKR